MPKFLCTYKSNNKDVCVGFDAIAEVVAWLKSFGKDRETLNPKVFIDVGEHKYLEIIVYFGQ